MENFKDRLTPYTLTPNHLIIVKGVGGGFTTTPQCSELLQSFKIIFKLHSQEILQQI